MYSASSRWYFHAQPDGGVAKTILVEGQGYEKPETGDEVTGECLVTELACVGDPYTVTSRDTSNRTLPRALSQQSLLVARACR